MTVVDLRVLEGDQVVIHFGGTLNSVDAYTFANALVSFADTARAVNEIVNPGQAIEIRLDAVGPGSFRAVIRRIQKGLGGFFSRGGQNLFWAIIAALIYDNVIKADPGYEIRVEEDQVVIQRGDDRIVLSREIFDQLKNVQSSPEVQKNLSKTFKVIERDDAIESFGLTNKIDDPEPLVEIPRSDFPRLAEPPLLQETEKRRERRETARLLILKAWFREGTRKWSFEWNGVPITAPIKDPDFWAKLEKRQYLIGVGDALDVIITFTEIYLDELDLFMADPNSYVIEKVIRPVPRQPDATLEPFLD
jgi:hypothetical protein